ncbi:HNH endonuclease, partial [Megamonas hypermegale]|uniref:HNH endonuclease n=1 Tax=Megamonas hypermegale TaxID=158847 RepID=UPI00350E50DA
MMWRACSRCGRIHSTRYTCTAKTASTTTEQRLRNRSRWRKKREEIREASGYLCAVCLDQGRYTYDGLEVHHITKLRQAPELLLENNNLICLCTKHHKEADEGKLPASYLKELAERRESNPPSLGRKNVVTSPT